MKKSAVKTLQQTIFEDLTKMLDKPTSKWQAENDKALSERLDSLLSPQSEKVFLGQINGQKALKEHFFYLIYDALKHHIDDSDVDIGALLQDNSYVTSVFDIAKQISLHANQLFLQLEKSPVELRSFIAASSHIDISLTRSDGQNCFHILAQSKGAKLEDVKAKFELLISAERSRNSGLDINARAKDGFTPIMLALESSNIEIFNYLSSLAESDLGLKNDRGQNLLHMILYLYDPEKPASDKKAHEINNLLITEAAELIRIGKISFLERDVEEKTPLHLIIKKDLNKLFHLICQMHLSDLDDYWEQIVTDAVIFNREVMLRKALAYPKAQKFVNDAGSDGKSLAQIATLSDNPDILNLLREFKSDFSVCDGDGNSLAHLAITKPKVLKYLLDQKDIDLNYRNGFGEDVVAAAAKAGSKEVIDILLEKCENIITQLFVTAVSFGNLEIVMHLLDDKQRVTQGNKTTNTIEMPIYLKYKLDLYLKDAGGNILQKAILSLNQVKDELKKKKILETIDYFLTFIKDSPAILNDVNIHCDAPIHTAVNGNMVDLVRILVKHKADLSKLDVTRLAPIQIAIAESRIEIVKELMLSCDLNLGIIESGSIRSLLHIAASGGDIKILSEIWSAINAQGDIRNIVLQQDSMKNNFLHIFISNNKITDDDKLEFIANILPELKSDAFKVIFDQENNLRETVRNLFILNEKLKAQYLDELPEFVMFMTSKADAVLARGEKVIKRPAEKVSADIAYVVDEIDGVKGNLLEIRSECAELRRDFFAFTELCVGEFRQIKDMLAVLGGVHHEE